MEQPRASAPAGTLQWLEEEQHRSKINLSKLQQQMEQLQAGLWGQLERMQQGEQALSAVVAQLARLPKLEEQLRQLQALSESSQESGLKEEQRRAAEERVRQAELERERQARSELGHRLELQERDGQSLWTKLTALEDGYRRYSEPLLQLQQGAEQLAHEDQQLQGRIQSLLEQIRHGEGDLDRLRQEQEALRKQDEVISGRLHILGEQVKGVQDQTEAILSVEQLQQELQERLEVQRMERQRLERQSAEIQTVQEEQHSRLEDLIRELALLSGKNQTLTEHLDQVREQLWGVREEIVQHFSRLAETEEQQKRRQIVELEQQVRELRARSQPTGS